jgi:tetratricopeptide (TPR) repeat protein
MRKWLLTVAGVLAAIWAAANLAVVLAQPRTVSSRRNTNPVYLKKRAEIRRLAREGHTALYRNDFITAERLLRQALTLDSRYVEAWYDLGRTLEEQNRLAEALSAYRRVFYPTPDYGSTFETDPAALSRYALLCDRVGRWQEAVQVWERASRSIEPQSDSPQFDVNFSPRVRQSARFRAAANLAQGITFSRRGWDDQALEAFERAARAQPSPVTQYYLGYGLRTAGRHEEAEKAFRRAALGTGATRAAAQKALRRYAPMPGR